jgi:phosphoribosylaminoimidazole-succinocarboxamide synthase
MDVVGSQVGNQIVDRSLAVFDEARHLAHTKGITIVDTKFEFGYIDGELALIDEVFTPDSSRFLAAGEGGGEALNLDKQFVRDYLDRTGWDRNLPAPELPPDVATEARRRYLMILERLTGEGPRWAR